MQSVLTARPEHHVDDQFDPKLLLLERFPCSNAGFPAPHARLLHEQDPQERPHFAELQ